MNDKLCRKRTRIYYSPCDLRTEYVDRKDWRIEKRIGGLKIFLIIYFFIFCLFSISAFLFVYIYANLLLFMTGFVYKYRFNI